MAIRRGKKLFENLTIWKKSGNRATNNQGKIPKSGRLQNFHISLEKIARNLFVEDLVQNYQIQFLLQPVENCLPPPVYINKEEVFLVDEEI